MKAAVLHGKHELTVENVPDAVIREPGDAVVRVVAAGICGTDLHGYHGLPGPVTGPRCGHEFVGVVEDIGSEVSTLRRGTMVVAPFNFADGTCPPCRTGLHSACAAGGMFGVDGDGAQAEAVRVPFADATLVAVPVDRNDERLPSLLALTDSMATGLHAVRTGRVAPGSTVAVLGDGPVGMCAVLAAGEAGAGRIILVGRHETRLGKGRDFGATDTLQARGPESGAESVDFVRTITQGLGADVVVECGGGPPAQNTAFALCRTGGTVCVMGGPPIGDVTPVFFRGITLTGGLTPARVYLPELVDRVLAGTLDPGPIFDEVVALDDIVSGYEAMAARTATKVLVRP
ncbi:alcohol dehydrogenase catalytic domain-containing protein [Lentzea sp. NEAU-D7]|uniref:alcohol dehydrogenase catalytic domain-containing protein n=1 Tax=Lentzea sp. NEAU-D7 TaxID=2994667 RepID=UPI00224A7DE7|nr:alcohol dehydrogenase catalytic domain-containing protein [Lentzea sp. NEAU-D7]MCX2954729.1 alcohol dehydrogenase catalytic domain-containing protein [Lentzea sp. NEAU-D7]